jgi:hypothetical protein
LDVRAGVGFHDVMPEEKNVFLKFLKAKAPSRPRGRRWRIDDRLLNCLTSSEKEL